MLFPQGWAHYIHGVQSKAVCHEKGRTEGPPRHSVFTLAIINSYMNSMLAIPQNIEVVSCSDCCGVRYEAGGTLRAHINILRQAAPLDAGELLTPLYGKFHVTLFTKWTNEFDSQLKIMVDIYQLSSGQSTQVLGSLWLPYLPSHRTSLTCARRSVQGSTSTRTWQSLTGVALRRSSFLTIRQ